MIQAVIFDFRDTLLKVSDGYKAMNRRLFTFVRSYKTALNYKQFERQNMRVILSQKARIAKNTKLHDAMPVFVESLLKQLKIKPEDEEYIRLLRGMNDDFAVNVSLYPDAESLLKELKQRKLKTAVVIDGTSYRERKIIRRLGLAKYLNVVVISEEVGFNKFTSKPLEAALRKLKTTPANALVVGDRLDKDIIHANKLGCVSVRLVRNQGRYAALVSVKKKEKPDHTIRNFSELRKFVV